MADAIFISYRRDDSEGEAGRLFDDLTRAFGSDAVFMDVAGIKPGVDFRKAIDENVASCGVFLAVVGPTWATITNPGGTRRLDDPNDFVALELSTALKREVPVIPVLVHDAKMPAVSLLPESLQAFAYRNSVELSHARWNSDVGLLVEALKSYVTPKVASEAPVHATVSVQLPAPHHPTGNIVPETVAKNWKRAILGAIAAALLLIVVLYFAFRESPANQDGTTSADPSNPVPQTMVPATPSASEYVGTWERTDGVGNSDALEQLKISKLGPGFTVEAFGRCAEPPCDWGEKPGTFTDADLVATFSPPPNGTDTSRTAMVKVHPVSGGLDVSIYNDFEGPQGHHANTSHHVFSATQ